MGMVGLRRGVTRCTSTVDADVTDTPQNDEKGMGHHLDCVNPYDEHTVCLTDNGDYIRREALFDDEFGLCMDPCEHPSVNGGVCAACDEEVPFDG